MTSAVSIAEVAGAVIRFYTHRFADLDSEAWLASLDRFERGVQRIADWEDTEGPRIDGCYIVMFHGRRQPDWYRQRVEQVAMRAFR
jgi:hypothetical protein